MSINKIVDIGISIVSFVMISVVLLLINSLNVLPFKYFITISIIVLLINFIATLFIFIDNKVIKIIGYIIIVILFIFNIIACYYIKTTDNFLSKSFKNKDIPKEKVEEPFNIYIGGTDFTNQIYDFNAIITINKKKKQILLTSIPRDYHIKIYGKEQEDNLSYHGILGIETTIGSLEQLFDTKINYYIKINTNSLVKLVDLLNGLEYCSSESFTTTHATILDSYDDTKGEKLYVGKGCKKYNGIEILTIARERKNIKGGDTQRQINCQTIMTSLFNKLMNPSNLTNYKNILESVNELYETNVPKNIITNYVKYSFNTKWNVQKLNAIGTDTKGYVRLNSVYDYIMIPDYSSVSIVKDKIKEMLNN